VRKPEEWQVLLHRAHTALLWAEQALVGEQGLASAEFKDAGHEIHIARVYIKRAQDLIDAQLKNVAPKSTIFPPQPPSSPAPSRADPNSTSSTDTPK
jgi:hypothetical protein